MSTDVDIVRWAFVKILMLSPEYKAAADDRNRQLISKNLFGELVTASPQELQFLLEIDDLTFAERVARAIKANEVSKTKQ